MFNLAKKKGLPHNLQQEAALHKSRLAQREQSLQEDARRAALMMVQSQFRSPKDVMAKFIKMEQYWYYVRKYDPGYMKDVIALAAKLAVEVKKHPDRYIPVAPPPKQQGGDAGGGAPGGAGLSLGSTSKQMKLAGKSRDLATEILSGVQHYIGKDGCSYRLVGAEDATPKGEAASKTRSEMPDKVAAAIEGFLEAQGVSHPREISRMLAEDAWKKHFFDLRPASVAIGGVLLGFLMDANGGSEPGEVLELRRKIGAAMSPYVEALRAEAEADGHKIFVKQALMPAYTVHGRAQRKEKHSHSDRLVTYGNPQPLSMDEIGGSVDVRSLLMTISAQSSDDAKAAAADRLVRIMCRDPQLYQDHKLSKTELSHLVRAGGSHRSKERLARLSKFCVLLDGDDADLMEAYADASDEDKENIAYVVACQGRDDIASAVPSLSFNGRHDKPRINNVLFEKLDVSDEDARGVILAAFMACHNNAMKPSIDLVSRKLMDAVLETGDDALLKAALRGPYKTRCFAISYLLERGGASSAEASEAMRKLPFDKEPSQWPARLACASACKHGSADPGLLRLAMDAFGVRPRDVIPLVGKSFAEAYMRANRVDWDGSPVPQTSEIYSLPDDPMSLAMKVVALGDEGAMVSMLSMCEHSEDGYVSEHVAGLLKEALRTGGSTWPSLPVPPQASVLADGTVMTQKEGVYFVGNKCFASSRQDAEEIATGLLIKEAAGRKANR